MVEYSGFESLNDDEFFLNMGELFHDAPTRLPTGTMPALDDFADDFRGVTLLRGVPNGIAGILAAQIGVDAVINNAATMFLMFRNLVNKSLTINHARWHGVKRGNAILRRILTYSHDIEGRIPVAECDLRTVVEREKKVVRADHAIVVVDDSYRYRKQPERRTLHHERVDYEFVKRVYEAHRASGDPWLVVADHDMKGCFDRVIECVSSRSPKIANLGRLNIQKGESRDLVGQIDIKYDKWELRYKEQAASACKS